MFGLDGIASVNGCVVYQVGLHRAVVARSDELDSTYVVLIRGKIYPNQIIYYKAIAFFVEEGGINALTHTHTQRHSQVDQ